VVGPLLAAGVEGLLGVAHGGLVQGLGADGHVAAVDRGVADRDPVLRLEGLVEETGGGGEHVAPDGGVDAVSCHQEEAGVAQRPVEGAGQGVPVRGLLGPGGEAADVETGQLGPRGAGGRAHGIGLLWCGPAQWWVRSNGTASAAGLWARRLAATRTIRVTR
jgi:hypothetical protein